MVPLAGLIDTAFLGHLSEVRFLNGVALATVIFNVSYWGFNFFRMGTTGPTAQAVGSVNLGLTISLTLLVQPIPFFHYSLVTIACSYLCLIMSAG